MRVLTLDKKLLVKLVNQIQVAVVAAEIFLVITTKQIASEVLVVQVSLLLED
jgi:hypothetical protein